MTSLFLIVRKIKYLQVFIDAAAIHTFFNALDFFMLKLEILFTRKRRKSIFIFSMAPLS